MRLHSPKFSVITSFKTCCNLQLLDSFCNTSVCTGPLYCTCISDSTCRWNKIITNQSSLISRVTDADGLFADTADADIRPVANSPDDPIVAAVVLRAPNRAYVSAPLLRASKCRHPAATFPLARRQRVAGAEDVQPAVRSRASAPRAGRSGAGHQGRQELPLFLGLGRNSPWV